MSKQKDTSVYQMTRDEWLDYFELHVSTTSEIMRKHIKDIAQKDGWDQQFDGWEETKGLVHPMQTLDGPFAYLFLAEDHLGVGVVAHECLHVAMAHERFVLRFRMQYGPQIGEDEERLAYFLTSTIRGVYDILYKYEHIKTKGAKDE